MINDMNGKICPLALMSGGSLLACVLDECPLYQKAYGCREYKTCKVVEKIEFEVEALYHAGELEVTINSESEIRVDVDTNELSLSGLLSVRTREE